MKVPNKFSSAIFSITKVMTSADSYLFSSIEPVILYLCIP